jgi:hypothetical protein
MITEQEHKDFVALFASPEGVTAGSVPGASAVTVGDLAHSPTGPSSAERIIRCPGSLRVSAVCPQKDDEHSSRGTRLHGIVGQVCAGDRAGYDALPAEDQAAVDFVVEAVKDAQALMPVGGLDLWEERIDLSDCGAGFGTVDHAVVVPGSWATIEDFKFGARAVKAPQHNWQLILYAHGIARAFGVRQVTTTILRPAADDPWRKVGYIWSAEDLAGLARAYREAVDLAHSPMAPLCVGEHCTFCAGREMCPARWAAVAMVPRFGSFKDLVRSLSAEDRRRLWDRVRMAQAQLGALRECIEAGAIAGDWAVAGCSVEASEGRRGWANEAEAAVVLARLASAKGKPADAVWMKDLISPAQAEKLLGKSAAITAEMAPLIVRKPGAPALKAVG